MIFNNFIYMYYMQVFLYIYIHSPDGLVELAAVEDDTYVDVVDVARSGHAVFMLYWR